MGMGYAANYADVIQEKEVEIICPNEYKAFLDILEKAKIDLDTFAKDVAYNADDHHIQEIVDGWFALEKAFEKATGLWLTINHHDQSNDGSRYDDVDGYFFEVGNVYQLTPAGEKLKDKIKRKFYVSFG